MKKILVVDDEQEIRNLIQERLTQSKYEVLTASSGSQALDIAKTSKPDLILLDVAMPQMDGYAACEKLREGRETKKTPILFLTGKDLDPKHMDSRCEELFAQGYISKLSTLKELLDVIKETIGE